MQDGSIHIRREGAVVHATLDFPPLNLVGGAFIVSLIGLLNQLDDESDVRVVVFRSADPDYFLMHGDVEAIIESHAGYTGPVTEPNIASVNFARLRAAPYVSIGVIDGIARGGGCEFLSALDLRIGSTRTVVGQPEVAMGILPGAGGSTLWPRIVGRGAALELLLTCRDMGADEALACGWLQRLVTSEELDAAADELANSIARMPAASIAAVKRVVDVSLSGIHESLVAETDVFAQLTATGAHVEPMRRFLAAGGQTRDGELGSIAPLLDAMLD